MFAALTVAMIFFIPGSPTAKIIILAAAAVGFSIFRNYLFPVLGILSCLYLIFYLPPTSWLRFAAWLNFGFLIYVAFGSIHSRLMSSDMKKRSLAYTARLGVILLFIGDALLFLTRGFDLHRMAHKGLTHLAGWERFTTALHQTLQAKPWLEMSWFLVIPLALNALVLCPLIIRRSAQANSLSEADKRSRASSAAATFVMVLSLIYLAAVIF